MKRRIPIIVWVLGLGCLLAGCDHWAEVNAGLYVPTLTFNSIDATEVTDYGIEYVFVDIEHERIWVAFNDGTLDVLPYKARSKSTWPSGCPTNINATRMEVLDLDVERLALVSATIAHPIIVRDCPPDPQEIVLRADGAIGGSRTARGEGISITLRWKTTLLSLPHSMKGYALYSWYMADNDTWRYTLVTGTNRPHIWEEIAAPENQRTEEGWIKITVDGETALKSVLDRLPEGEIVVWNGPDSPQTTATLQEQVNFPDTSLMREIRVYGRQQGIDLRTEPFE